ncbi:MAG: hypothetical protein ACRETM_02890 [Stenotrophobium sp.]
MPEGLYRERPVSVFGESPANDDLAQGGRTYRGANGQQFTITDERFNELRQLQSDIVEQAHRIFGEQNVDHFQSEMSASGYIEVPGGGKIRVSDHALPQRFVAKHGPSDIEVASAADVPRPSRGCALWRMARKRAIEPR